jgi:2'-5' RNA ligase
VRLFTALWLPPEAVGHLADTLAGISEVAAVTMPSFRWMPAKQWHLTLCFHGDDADVDKLAGRLRRRARGRRAPLLRLASAGTFGGVLWVGVEPAGDDDRVALRALVKAAGRHPVGFRAHLTVARWSRGRPDRTTLTAPLADYCGPWWRPEDVVLVRSEQLPAGPRYTPMERVPLVLGER